MIDRDALDRKQRLLLAVVIIVGSFALSFSLLSWRGYVDADLTSPLEGARAILRGEDPWNNPRFAPGNPWPYNERLFTPLPGQLALIPLTPLPPYYAGATFFALSSGLLAYALSREGLHRLPVFLSSSFVIAAMVAQWSPLLMASAVLPWLTPLAFGAKPNLALALAAAYPRPRWLLVSAAVFAASLLVMPSWPLAWLHEVQQHHHPPPLLYAFVFPPGLLLLYALVTFRRPEGRLLIVLGLVPQLLFFYDQLLLWLVPRTWRQSLWLTAWSWVGWAGWFIWGYVPNDMGAHITSSRPWAVACLYLPALVLWQDERSHRSISLLRSWLSQRGLPAARWLRSSRLTVGQRGGAMGELSSSLSECEAVDRAG